MKDRMSEIEYATWLMNIVAAASEDRRTGKQGREGKDFPIKAIPNEFKTIGVSNLAAQVYNCIYFGWDEQ